MSGSRTLTTEHRELSPQRHRGHRGRKKSFSVASVSLWSEFDAHHWKLDCPLGWFNRPTPLLDRCALALVTTPEGYKPLAGGALRDRRLMAAKPPACVDSAWDPPFCGRWCTTLSAAAAGYRSWLAL